MTCLVLAGEIIIKVGSPSILGIAELIVPIGAFFSCSNTCLIPHYRRVFPKSEDDPLFGYQKQSHMLNTHGD